VRGKPTQTPPELQAVPDRWRDLVARGQFGKLTFVGCAQARTRHGQKRAVCRCACGNFTVVSPSSLRAGATTSCGCAHTASLRTRNQQQTKHGHASGGRVTPEYRAWAAMLNRCLNAQDPRYVWYGGQGVKVHPAWQRDFKAFLADVGARPSSKHSLDRWPDPAGDYAPGNIRWATAAEQNRNKRATRYYEFRGERLALPEIAERTHQPYSRVYQRVVKLDWTVEEAVTALPDDPLTPAALRGRWHALIARCTDPAHPRWKDYGGRGIQVCERWRLSFDLFVQDVGLPPSVSYSLDRIDNNRGYVPGNTRWTTHVEQNRNRRNTKLYTLAGHARPLAEWAELAGVPYPTVKRRLSAGWPLDEALGTPPGNTGRAVAGSRKKWAPAC
jgi:hypothetical protein